MQLDLPPWLEDTSLSPGKVSLFYTAPPVSSSFYLPRLEPHTLANSICDYDLPDL